jgi:hypothetical protein
VDKYPFRNEKLLELLLAIKPEDNDPLKLSAQIERLFNQILMTVLVSSLLTQKVDP